MEVRDHRRGVHCKGAGTMTRTVAGKALLTCPDCGATVREDLLPDHATRCPRRAGAMQTRGEVKAATPQAALPQQTAGGKENRLITCPHCGKQIVQRHFERHRQVCRAQSQPTTQRPAAPKPSAAKPVSASEHASAQTARAQAEVQATTPKTISAQQGNGDKADELIVCPKCKRPFAERYYQRHLQFCRGRTKATAKSGATKRVPTKPVAAIPVPWRPGDMMERDGSKTLDGYTIDTCWDCGQRICLVPEGDTFRVFDIFQKRKSAVPHQCNGSAPDSRRTRLIYIDPKLGSVAQSDKKHGRRKL